MAASRNNIAQSGINEAKILLENSFCIFHKVWISKNPFVEAYTTIVRSINNMLTINARLQMTKRNVNAYRYRIYQLEQVMNANNPNNNIGGKKLNHLR